MSTVTERIPDFAPTLYASGESRRSIRDIRQITDDLWSVWAEYDLKPSPIRLFLRDGSLKDKYGDDLVDQTRAAAVVRVGRVEQDRVEAELMGVERLRELLLSGEAKDGIIYLSPPGDTSEGFGGEGKHRLSFTYLYHVGNAGRIHFVAVPELEISIRQHINKVNNIIDRGTTEEITGLPLESLSDRGLVAYPFIAADKESLNEIARLFGYSSLLELWKSALEAKRIRGRVGGLIQHVGEKIWEHQINQDLEQLASMGDVFRGMAALLTGSGLDDIDDLNSYYDSRVRALVASRNIDRLGGVTYAKYAETAPILKEFYWRMHANSYALEKVRGGSCPGDRGLGFEVGLLNRNNNMLVENHVMMSILGEDLQSENEEHYSFDHEGKCVVCKQDPRMLGPCGICKDCDHKIRSQVE